MQTLVDRYKKTQHIHHAYIVEGHVVDGCDAVLGFCSDTMGLSVKGNPDVIVEQYERFSIDHARRLRELQLNKATSGGKKVFVVGFYFITREAQNALLKVLEEPTDGTHIFIVTPRRNIFLPTVLSRVESVQFQSENSLAPVTGKEFLQSSYADRLSLVTKLVKDIKDEKESRIAALYLVQDVIQTLREDLLQHKKPETASSLHELESIASYMHDQGASLKMLLEHMAVSV